jgi:FkbM family methyltransferase
MHLKKGMTFVDIGTNIGQHSMYAASIVGETGKVYCFEPIPFIYEQLRDSIRHNHFETIVHPKNIALGLHGSEEKLHISRKNVGGSSLVTGENESEVITVHVKNGGDELKDLKEVNVIKIDVEGYEYEVLSGIHDIITKHSPVIILEFSGELYKKQGHGNSAKIMKLLRDCNYSLFDIEDDMKKIIDDERFISDLEGKRKQTNLLCIPLKSS